MRRYGVLLAAVLALSATAASQTIAPTVLDLKVEVIDLVFEVEDLEASAAALASKAGDLAVTETATEVHLDLAADVLFDFNKADIRPAAQETLKKVAAVIREKAKGEVLIEGHTDSIASDTYNQRLSERRANAVKSWLTDAEGLDGTSFTVRGHGERKPVAPNTKPDGSDDPEGRQKNRRVEITVKKL